MDLSIIIVNWNTRKLLAGCLESLAKDVIMAGGQNIESNVDQRALRSEIFVVDNASTDDSVALVRERFPQVQLIENPKNVGFARANNQAIRDGRGRYVLLLNSDTEVYPGALKTMVEFMDRHPQAGGCGPRLLNSDGSLQGSCYPMLTPGREFWRLVFLDRLWRRATYNQEVWDQNEERPVEVIKGACLLLRRSALQQVGLLDGRYFMYTEEVDLCYRLALAGWGIWWVPRAIVKHYGEASSAQLAEAMYIQLYRSKVQFYRKFGGRHQVERFKRLLRLAYSPRLAIATVGTPFSPTLAARARIYRRLLAELSTM